MHKRPAWLWGIVLSAALLSALAFVLWRQGARRQPERSAVLPRAQSQCNLFARWLEDERVLAVTQDWSLLNTSEDTWPDVRLQFPANAYRTEELSPAASDDAFERSFPAGFSPGGMTLMYASVNGALQLPAYADESGQLAVFDVSVSPGESVSLSCRYLLSFPQGLHRFGEDGMALRLCRALAAPAVWQDGAWHTGEQPGVGDGWYAPLLDYSYSVEVPAGFFVSAPGCSGSKGRFSGFLPSADSLNLIIWKGSPVVRTDHCGGGKLTVAGLDRSLVSGVFSRFKKALEALSALYGACPMEEVCVCALPSFEDGSAYPGLIVLSDAPVSSDAALSADQLYWAARQWFASPFRTDGSLEGWLPAALSEWAAQQAMLKADGRQAFAYRKEAFVDEAMRENLHLTLTPGSPLSWFPDSASLDALQRGRGCAWLYAVDTMTEGRLNGFLKGLAEAKAGGPLSGRDFLDALKRYFSMDFEPLYEDYIHTYIF